MSGIAFSGPSAIVRVEVFKMKNFASGRCRCGDAHPVADRDLFEQGQRTRELGRMDRRSGAGCAGAERGPADVEGKERLLWGLSGTEVGPWLVGTGLHDRPLHDQPGVRAG